METLSASATPEQLAKMAEQTGCRSVAFTYNDPVIFMEYALDVAAACHARDIKTIAVTAGYINPEPRRDFFAGMDAANVDLKGFTESFYHRICGGHLAPVLDTLRYLKQETKVWFELTTLLIPGENDSAEELEAMCRWIADELGPDVPLHFTAFHPDFHMLDKPSTSMASLLQARDIAKAHGLHYVYVGNVHDVADGSTWCPSCGKLVIERDYYRLGSWAIHDGCCQHCGAKIAGVFENQPGTWGPKRLPVEIR